MSICWVLQISHCFHIFGPVAFILCVVMWIYVLNTSLHTEREMEMEKLVCGRTLCFLHKISNWSGGHHTGVRRWHRPPEDARILLQLSQLYCHAEEWRAEHAAVLHTWSTRRGTGGEWYASAVFHQCFVSFSVNSCMICRGLLATLIFQTENGLPYR